jgi:hypothetical protein
VRSQQLKSRIPALLTSLLLLAGCLSSGQAPSSVVTGKVTLAGAPLTAGSVLFMTDAGQAATAELGPDGAYTVKCQPGSFKVAVTPPPPVDPLSVPAGTAPAPSNQPAIPRKYQDLGSSGLAIDVKEGDNTFDIALTR